MADLQRATAVAHPNIALIKYWGRQDAARNIPLTDSLSITLDGLSTRTTVIPEPEAKADSLILDGQAASDEATHRVARHLEHLRKRAGVTAKCRVVSENSFPAAAGLASSASAFAALTHAGFAAFGAEVDLREQSAFARLGSGSAARSIHGGFVAWQAGTGHEDSVAMPLAGPDHFDVHDVVAILSRREKKTGSLHGHALAHTSPLLQGRLEVVPKLLARAKEGVIHRDMVALGEPTEADCYLMHAVMMTSEPSLLYWAPETVAGLHAVREWRDDGLAVYATIDAGPNLHFISKGADAPEVARRARALFGEQTEIIDAPPGEGARLVDDHLA